MDACTTLLVLQPKLQDADLYQLVDTATQCVLNLPPCTSDEQEKLLKQTLVSTQNLIAAIVEKDPTAPCLLALVTHLQKWMTSRSPHQVCTQQKSGGF